MNICTDPIGITALCWRRLSCLATRTCGQEENLDTQTNLYQVCVNGCLPWYVHWCHFSRSRSHDATQREQLTLTAAAIGNCYGYMDPGLSSYRSYTADNHGRCSQLVPSWIQCDAVHPRSTLKCGEPSKCLYQINDQRYSALYIGLNMSDRTFCFECHVQYFGQCLPAMSREAYSTSEQDLHIKYSDTIARRKDREQESYENKKAVRKARKRNSQENSRKDNHTNRAYKGYNQESKTIRL